MLRYQEDNELHKDFHSSTNMTLDYIAGKYGVDALKMILRRTGKNVYKSIHDKLARGDASELVEHLNWFFMREKGKYQLTVEDDKIVFEVLSSLTSIYTGGIPSDVCVCVCVCTDKLMVFFPKPL